MLETLLFFVAYVQQKSIVLNKCTTPHVHFHVDLGSAATTISFTTSGVLFHNCTMTHDRFHLVLVLICTAPHNGFRVDLGSAATILFTASGVPFHNCTTHYVCFFLVDLGPAPTNVMTTERKRGGSSTTTQ